MSKDEIRDLEDKILSLTTLMEFIAVVKQDLVSKGAYTGAVKEALEDRNRVFGYAIKERRAELRALKKERKEMLLGLREYIR